MGYRKIRLFVCRYYTSWFGCEVGVGVGLSVGLSVGVGEGDASLGLSESVVWCGYEENNLF